MRREVLALLIVACGGNGAPVDREPPRAEPPPGSRPAPAPTGRVPGGVAAGCEGKLGRPGDRTLEIASGGQTRTAAIHVPAKADNSRAVPLVLGFHGYLE